MTSARFSELIDHLCKAGIRGIVLFGAAGEYPSFTADERARVLYLAVKRSRAPILAGVGSASFDASVSLAREARDAGAAGLLLPPPFFFRYGQDEIREFYLQFAAEAGKGVPHLSLQRSRGQQSDRAGNRQGPITDRPLRRTRRYRSYIRILLRPARDVAFPSSS